MKSRLFSRFDPLDKANESFRRDLETLLSLTADQRTTLLESIVPLSRAANRVEVEELAGQVSASLGLDMTDLAYSISLSQFLLRQLENPVVEEDDPAAWARDLQDMGLVDESQVDDLSRFLVALKERVAPEALEVSKKQEAAGGLFPSLRTVGTTAELRAVVRRTWRFGTDVNSYVPEISDLAGVVSVFLRFDSGFPDTVVFQVSKDGLRLLTESLEAAKRELEALEGFGSSKVH